jgi:hypothetical protein
MQGFAYYRKKNSKGLGGRCQSGVSLIPALITICIFTLLSSKVIVPNNIREANKAHIKAVANSAEQLIQATHAYYAVNKSWPTSIMSDLVPTYLPFFNQKTLWGESWGIIKYDQFGWPINSSTPDHISFTVSMPAPQIAREMVLKIGPHAKLTNRVVDSTGAIWTQSGALRAVEVYPAKAGTTTVDSLNITGNFELGSTGTTSTFKLNGNDITAGLNTLSGSGSGSSSKRFKQNIHPLETPIENIYQLKPVTYNYKEAFKQYKTPNAAHSEIGLIAEQVFPLIPEITLLDNDNKVMGIDYPKLSILLLSAVQALKAEVTALQKNNQQLQQQMDALNIESEGLNIEGQNSANINNARTDHGTDE